MTERMMLRILELEEKNMKTTVEGQLALVALFLNAIKQQTGQQAQAQGNHSTNISGGVLEMPTPPTSNSVLF
jgi:hypothetical protein